MLDNLDHLLDAGGNTAGLLEHLLAQAAGVVVLATSRERLRDGFGPGSARRPPPEQAAQCAEAAATQPLAATLAALGLRSHAP